MPAASVLTFLLDTQPFALLTTQVHGVHPVKEVERVDTGVPGVVGTLRRKRGAAPVVDARVSLFGQDAAADSDFGQVIVVAGRFGGRLRPVGLLVDDVAEVMNLEALPLSPPAAELLADCCPFVSAVLDADGLLVLLIDTERLLAR